MLCVILCSFTALCMFQHGFTRTLSTSAQPALAQHSCGCMPDPAGARLFRAACMVLASLRAYRVGEHRCRASTVLHTQCGCQMFTAIGVYQLPEQLETQFFQCNLSEWSILIDANEKNGSLAALKGEVHELGPQLTSVYAPAISDCNRRISSFRAA